MTRIELYVSDGRQLRDLTEYSNFMNARIEYSLNIDDYSYYFDMRDVIVSGAGTIMFIYPECTFFNVTVRYTDTATGITVNFSGRITLEDVEFFEKDYCKINIRLDNLDEFISKIQAIVLKKTHNTLVLREPQRDPAAMGLLLLGISVASSIIFFTYSFVNVRLTATAVASTGVGAPGAGAYLVTSYIILAIYLSLFIVSLIQLARQVADFIKSIRANAHAFNLYDCVINIARSAGNLTVNTLSINDVRDVYIISPATRNNIVTEDIITASEIIDAVKKTLNARLYIFNNQLKFIYNQGFIVPAVLRRGFVERFRYDTRDLQNIFLFTLQRDPAEGYSYLDVEAAFERRTECAAGYKRITLPYAPHRIKNFPTFVDRAYNFFTTTLFVLTAGLGGIAFGILRALNIIRKYEPKYGHIIVEAEGWIQKIIKTNNIEKPDIQSENAYIRSVAPRYRNRLLRVINTKISMSPSELYDLAQNGFESVRKLTYYIHDQYAEVEYEEEVPIYLNLEERFI